MKPLLQLAIGVGIVVAATMAIPRSFSTAPEPAGWTILRPPHETSAIALAGDTVWAGGRDGLFAFDRRTGRLLQAGAPDVAYVKDILVDSRGRLLVAHADGVSIRAGDVWTAIGPSDGYTWGAAAALAEWPRGTTWIGVRQGLVRCEADRCALVSRADGLASASVDVLFADGAEFLWAGSSEPRDAGLSRFDGQVWTRYLAPSSLAHDSVNALMRTRAGEFWVATGFGNRGAVSRLGPDGWSTWTTADGLAGPKARSVFEDRDGRIWVGSEYDGIAIFDDGRRLAILTPAEGLAGVEVKEMAQDEDGVYWLATENGVSRIATLPAGLDPRS